MTNLIKMNLYRMVHAVSTWVLAFTAVALALLDLVANKMIYDGLFGIDYGDLAKGYAGTTATNTIMDFLKSGDTILIVAIFLVIFVCAEHKSGFDKNIVGITPNRWKQTLARWISAVIGMTGILAISYGTYLGTSALFMNQFSFGDVTDYLKSGALVYFGVIVLSAIFFFFSTLFNSSTGGIVASLIVTTGLLMVIEHLLDSLAGKIFNNPAHLPSDFFYDTAFFYTNLNTAEITRKGIVFFLVLSAAYLVLSLGGSMLLQQKRDIK